MCATTCGTAQRDCTATQVCTRQSHSGTFCARYISLLEKLALLWCNSSLLTALLDVDLLKASCFVAASLHCFAMLASCYVMQCLPRATKLSITDSLTYSLGRVRSDHAYIAVISCSQASPILRCGTVLSRQFPCTGVHHVSWNRL